MSKSSTSGMILISCAKNNSKSIIKKAKKLPNVVEITQPRDKNDIGVIITLNGSEESIKESKNILYKVPEVNSIEYSIY